VDSEYFIEVEKKVPVEATPVAVTSLSFATPKQFIAAVLAEVPSVILFEPGKTVPGQRIRVADDPVALSGGGQNLAYVACRAAKAVDVIHQNGFVKRIGLPGQPQDLAWNGSYNPTKQKILVSCEIPGTRDGVVCVIDEETLTLTNVLSVGNQPRGIKLDWHRKHLWVANYGGDSVTIINQTGTKAIATLPTAGRPWTTDVSWSDPENIIISLRAGGVIQRMEASVFPPTLSGLTALSMPTDPPTDFTPECCMPVGEDHLWIAPDRFSESVALLVSNGREFQQIGIHSFGPREDDSDGLGQITLAGQGLPATLCIANRKRKQLIFATLRKEKRELPAIAANRERL